MIVNLGCGTRVHPEHLNIDFSMFARFRASPLLRPLAPLFFRGERLARFRALPPSMITHDLSRGIPLPDASADAIYMSHFLETIDREVARSLLHEVHRVLRPAGIVRVAGSDLEQLCRAYLEHLAQCERDAAQIPRHDGWVASIIELLVWGEALGSRGQPPVRRFLENAILGSARDRGQTRRWMYDRMNLRAALEAAGLRDVVVTTHRESAIPGWDGFGLDRNPDGGERFPGSMYLEARKPAG